MYNIPVHPSIHDTPNANPIYCLLPHWLLFPSFFFQILVFCSLLCIQNELHRRVGRQRRHRRAICASHRVLNCKRYRDCNILRSYKPHCAVTPQPPLNTPTRVQTLLHFDFIAASLMRCRLKAVARYRLKNANKKL